MSKNFNVKSTIAEVSRYGVSNASLTRLSLFLNRLVAGNLDAPPLYSAIAEKRGADKIFEDFNVIFESTKSVLNDNLTEIEMAQRDKFGPRSMAQPWSDIQAQTLATFDKSTLPTVPVPLAPEPHSAHHLRPMSISKVLTFIKNQTNSGLKDMVPKGEIKEKYLNEKLLMEEVDLVLPAVPFVRTQEQLKTRVVWGFPIAQVIYEGTVFYPLLEYSKKLNWLKGLVSPEAVDTFVSDMVLSCHREGGTLVSIDFSNYDTSVKKELQSVAFAYFRKLFQSDVSGRFDLIEQRFCSTPLITPDGIISGDHGIPSGSAFTNIVGSTVQASIAIDSGIIKPDKFQVLGDDGVYCLRNDSEADDLISKFQSCGLNVNTSKSYRSSNYCVFLQRLYDEYYISSGVRGGIYPVWRALNRIVHPERFVSFGQFGIQGKDYFSIRTLTILENCKYHPMFEELTKYVLSLDKYNLQFSSESLGKYVRMLEENEGTAGIIRNQYGENVKGIRDFASYKLVKKLISGGVNSSGED